MLGHRQHIPAHGLVPLRFSAGGKPWPLDHHGCSGWMELLPLVIQHLLGDVPHVGAVGFTERGMADLRPRHESVHPPGGAVHELDGEYDIAGAVVATKAAHSGGGDEGAHANPVEGSEVCPVVDKMWRHGVFGAMAGEERHVPTADLTQG